VPRAAVWILSAGAAFCAGTAGAQGFPSKTVRIVTSAAGGNFDMVARTLAVGMTGPLGQPVVVDNRGGVVAIETVAKAPADGYTLLLSGTTVWLSPFMRKNVSWDPVADFAPVTLAVSAPNVLVVHPSLPVKTVGDLIALARAKPGVLNVGSTTPGGSIHLAAELFNVMAHADIVRVSFRGEAGALTALMSGQIHLMFSNVSSGSPHIKSGRLRGIAVTSAQPSPLLPALPSIASSGLPGYEFVSITAVFAPARTPTEIIGRLNAEMSRVLRTPEVKERLFKAGVEAVGSSPEQLGATVKSEMARMGTLIRKAGISLDY
jgi:tripartite-type tricarboxylate transporter receptor subunit TctC